jgi:hypothetical protein
MTWPMTWFACGPYGVRSSGGRLVPDPQRVVHAKQLGTVLVACGRWAVTWHRFWDVEFGAVANVRRCPDCLDVVLAGRAAAG